MAEKKQIRGHLAGLMKMPIDIFTEVASHLMPEDIIVLSRSNKFFRNLLMRRSAIHIWHGAMHNVPELPPCPPDMCEPQYLALIYLPTCSICGGTSPHRMDEILLVRLCDSCCDDSTMPWDGLPADIKGLVHKSCQIGLRKRYWDTHLSALRSDVGAVLVKMEELKKFRNKAALAEWKTKREEELATRQEQAADLGAFLDDLELQEIARQNRLKLERRAEIERRLMLLGWDDKDFLLGSFDTREWEILVDQPVPITECIWTEVKPKLIRMLEANRTTRLVNEKLYRNYARKMKLEQIMADIKAADPPLIDTLILSAAPLSAPDSNAPAIRVFHRRLFPLTADLLQYPVIKSLDETDVPDFEMEARFESHREVIEAHVLEWRIKIEGHMAGLLREGRVSDGLKKAAPAPQVPVEKSKPNLFDGVSDDLKLLLRADSLFESKIDLLSIPVTYDSLLSMSLSNMWGFYRAIPLDLTIYKRYGEAQEVARALLAGMGKTNASFLELRGIGRRFKCGRCQSKMTHTWEEMVWHYVDEGRDWERFQAYIPKAQELGITFQHLHGLDAKPEKPFTKLIDAVETTIYYYYSGPSDFRCLLCMQAGVDDKGVTKDEVIEHVTKW